MLVLRYLFEQITWLLELRDTRLQHLPFTSIQSIAIVIALYLFFVLSWGPKFMEKRKPYNIERVMLFYNGFQVICNFSILYYTMYQLLSGVYEVNIWCEELDFSDSFVGMKSAQLSYCYYLIKIVDLFDTVFFVLRKRTRQISFLHVYHHVMVMTGAFIAISWAPGGHPWAFGLLNCFVHVLMYAYYYGTIYSAALKTNLFIKRSITQLQIMQFVISIIHLSIPFFLEECGYPVPLLIIAISQNAVMLLLFSDFYYKAYIKPNRTKVKST